METIEGAALVDHSDFCVGMEMEADRPGRRTDWGVFAAQHPFEPDIKLDDPIEFTFGGKRHVGVIDAFQDAHGKRSWSALVEHQ